MTTSDLDPVKGLLKVARQNNVSQIVVGKSKKNFFGLFSEYRNITTRLLRESDDIDICFVASTHKSTATLQNSSADFSSKLSSYFKFEECGWAISGLLLTWFVGGALEAKIGYQSVGLLFLLFVFIAALYLSRGIVLTLAVAAALTWDFFFIPPQFTFRISDPEDAILLLMYFFVALIVGSITNKLRTSHLRIQEREQSTQLLYRATRELSSAQNPDEVASTLFKIISDSLCLPCSVIIGGPAVVSQSRRYRGDFGIDEKEWAVAIWALTSSQITGKSTETLSHAKGYYIPMVADHKAVGLIALDLSGGTASEREAKIICKSLAQQAATVLQRENFRHKIVEVEILQKTQKLYSTLFDSVSHELKTPLAGIEGAASALLDEVTSAKETSRTELSQIILESSRRLTRVVDHFIDMSRVDSGFLKPRLENQALPEIFWSLVNEMKSELQHHILSVNFPDDLPLVHVDFRLLQGAIRNVLGNAIKYSPLGTAIEVTCKTADQDEVSLSIRDHGPGLPKKDPLTVFDKFFRFEPEKTGGLGLGLAIAKGFMEVQGGHISARNAPQGGAEFTLLMKGELK